MKLKVLAATIAAISAVSAGSAVAGTFIAPSKYSAAKDPCLVNQGGNGLSTTEANLAMPLYCRPEVILYIGGASAPALAVTLTTPPSVFEGNPFLIVPKSGSTVHGLNSAALGWYGYGKANTAIAGKRVYVAYNNKNGSAAGVKQLITKTSAEDEAKMVFPGDNGGCSVVGSGSVAAVAGSNVAYAGKYECTETASYEAGMAFSDVLPWELEHSELASANGGKVPDLSTGTLLKTDVLALQGFTVVVNLNLYKALQKRDVAAGRLAASCQDVISQDSLGAVCRPNISSIDYASLIRVGGITTAAKLLGDASDTKQITVQRRVDTSGTQAASNIYFLRQNCQGYGTDLAGVVDNTVLKNVSVTLAGVRTKGTFGGAMAKRGLPAAAAIQYFKADGSAGASTADSSLVVKTHGETGGVRTAIKDDTTGYSIGVVSLDGKEDVSGFGGNGRYVKLDGADPMLTGTLAAPVRDANQRINLVNGRWPFAVEFQAVYRAAATKSVAPNAGNALVDSTRALVIEGLKKSDASIPGLGFFSSGASDTRNGTDKITTVRRAGGNNCAPLVLN
jgi:hypothetical protein